MLNIIPPKEVTEILFALNKEGHQAYLVGGCVRDAVLNKPPKDWDIATSALPAEVKRIFPHSYDTGIQHGTVTVVTKGENVEVTTFRIDGEYEGFRRPKEVTYTSKLAEDLRRRDFTMNAMAFHPEEGLVDPFDGEKDLQKKCIRGVGQPEVRLAEDALRILRGIRFACQLGFFIEEHTLCAMKHKANLLAFISGERVKEELEKTLLSSDSASFPLLWESGALSVIAPRLTMTATTQKLLQQGDKIPCLLWALFLSEMELEDSIALLTALHFDHHSMRIILHLLQEKNSTLQTTETGLRRQMATWGDEFFNFFLLLRKANRDPLWETAAELSQKIKDRKDCVSLKQLAVTGTDLAELGMKPGKEMGELLHFLLDFVLEQPKQNLKNVLLQKAMVWMKLR